MLREETIGATDNSERDYLEWLIRADYERCHPSKGDKGLLRDWMAVAVKRAMAVKRDQSGPLIAAA